MKREDVTFFGCVVIAVVLCLLATNAAHKAAFIFKTNHDYQLRVGAIALRGNTKARLQSARSTNLAGADLTMAIARANRPSFNPKLARTLFDSWAGIYYGQFLAKLDPTPRQIEAFNGLAYEHQLRSWDIYAAAWHQGLAPVFDPGVKQLLADEDSSFHDQVSTLLGASAAQALVDYKRTAIPRTYIATWAGILYDQDPLTPAQGDQLISIVARNSQGYQNGEGTANDLVAWSDVLSQASSVLTLKQLAVVKELVSADQIGRSPETHFLAGTPTLAIPGYPLRP